MSHMKVYPPLKKNERKKKKQKQIIKVTSLLPKQTSKPYVTLQSYDKIVNTKDPNIHLFSIPNIVLICKILNAQKSSFKGLQTIIATIGIILHSQINSHFISFKCPKNCKMFLNHQIMFLNNQRESSHYGSPINSHGIHKKTSFIFLHLISIGHAPLFHIVSYMEILFLISQYHYIIQK
jgi:hypothetical protein